MHREQDIIRWATDRGIFDATHGSTRKRQADKTQEELNELFEAIDDAKITSAMDAIGDIFVTLVIQAHMWNMSIDECIEAAWQEIKDRKGKMINGLFVKESIDDATPEEWDEVNRCRRT
jgi:NTP pyrophosphatase (non-canonical NTP hydrolase)